MEVRGGVPARGGAIAWCVLPDGVRLTRVLQCADPETMNPVYGTCQQPGIVPSDCTADCAFDCDTPECSLGCFCGCNPEARAATTEILAQMQRRSRVLQHQHQMLALDSEHGEEGVDEPARPLVAGDADFWKSSLRALKHDEKRARRAEIKLQFQKKAAQRKESPRYKAHQLLVAQRKAAAEARAGRGTRQARVDEHGRLLAKDRDPFAEADGFSWDKFHPVNPYRVRGEEAKRGRSPYEQEVGRIDDVFDPAEDWDNVGSDDAFGKTTSWWGASLEDNAPANALATADDWWRHDPTGFAAGRPDPFGSYANDDALGWF